MRKNGSKKILEKDIPLGNFLLGIFLFSWRIEMLVQNYQNVRKNQNFMENRLRNCV